MEHKKRVRRTMSELLQDPAYCIRYGLPVKKSTRHRRTFSELMSDPAYCEAVSMKDVVAVLRSYGVFYRMKQPAFHGVVPGSVSVEIVGDDIVVRAQCESSADVVVTYRDRAKDGVATFGVIEMAVRDFMDKLNAGTEDKE